MPSHFVFDDVAQHYSRQRAQPPEVARAIGSAIAAQVGQGARILEIGVGTGMIAWPAVAAGCCVVGLDISRGMLVEVASQRPASVQGDLPLIQADMHALPCAAKSFDAVLMVRTLHLAQDWQQVLAEGVRVLRPGGAFLLGRIWVDPESAAGKIRQEMRRYIIAHAPTLKPPAAAAAVEQYLAANGAAPAQEFTATEWTTHDSPATLLETIAGRQDSESWILDGELLAGLMVHLRTWAATAWPDLTQPQPARQRFLLQVTVGTWNPQRVALAI